MEDVSGKKVLDFFGKLVHNKEHAIRQNKQPCCKTHMKNARVNGAKSAPGRKRGPGGIEADAAEYIEEPVHARKGSSLFYERL